MKTKEIKHVNLINIRELNGLIIFNRKSDVNPLFLIFPVAWTLLIFIPKNFNGI